MTPAVTPTRRRPSCFLDRAKPSYVGGMLEMANARLYGFWGPLTEGLRTGQPQNEAKAGGKPLRRALRRPGAAGAVPAAMTALSPGAGEAIAAKFPWQRATAPFDIGCAQGGLPVQSRWRIRTSPAAASTCPRSGRSSRSTSRASVSRTGCASPPATSSPIRCRSADVLMMGHILHDWDLDEKRMLLRKAHDALPPAAR